MTELEAIQGGSENVFQAVYHAQKDKLYFYFLSKTASSYLAQELVQQTFIKLWLYRDRLSLDITLEIQLFRIGRTTMIDLLRKRANERKVIQCLPLPETDTSLIDDRQEKETRQKINEIIRQLPSPGQQAFALSREQGLTYKEIARILSISPKTVEYHISKAISLLKKSIFFLLPYITKMLTTGVPLLIKRIL